MVRPYEAKDRKILNALLENTDYKIENKTFEINPYRNYVVLSKENIKAVLIYDFIYDRIELVYIYVESKERNKGYGKALLDYLMDISQKEKIANITLEVDVENKKALYLYKKYGFEIASIREKYYQNRNGYLMIRKM